MLCFHAALPALRHESVRPWIGSANPKKGVVVLGNKRLPGLGSVYRLELLRGFRLTYDGAPVDVPMVAQRLLALIALNDRPIRRGYISGTLWQDSNEEHAAASLRSSLWRVRSVDRSLVNSSGGAIGLSRDVEIDVRSLLKTARGHCAAADFSERLDALSGDLLPDWYEDWVTLERERLRQVRMHALEALAEELRDARRFSEALEAGHAALACEPLRESAHRILMTIHIAEHNVIEAHRQYDGYRTMLERILGIGPSREMENLLTPDLGHMPAD